MAIILLSHSLHGLFTGTDVPDFGSLFLNKIGFAPFGVPLAWTVVLGQVLTALLLLANRWLGRAAAFNIGVLLVGIATVHWPEGWFVEGGGRNGMASACSPSPCRPAPENLTALKPAAPLLPTNSPAL